MSTCNIDKQDKITSYKNIIIKRYLTLDTFYNVPTPGVKNGFMFPFKRQMLNFNLKPK